MRRYKLELVAYVVVLNWVAWLAAGDGLVHAVFHGFGMGVLSLLEMVVASYFYEINLRGEDGYSVAEWRKIARTAALVAFLPAVAAFDVLGTSPRLVFYGCFVVVAVAYRAGVGLPSALARPLAP